MEEQDKTNNNNNGARSRSSRRQSLKSHPQSNWKLKLRDKCLERVRADRTRLLWNTRLQPNLNLNPNPNPNPEDHKKRKMVIESTFRDIMSDELKRIKQEEETPTSISIDVDDDDDSLWEYDGLHTTSQLNETEVECEEILIEMQRIFYEEHSLQLQREQDDYEGAWKEEEDNYLAQVAFEHLNLNGDQVCDKKVWCPICKQGELREHHHVIYCTQCKLQLERGDEVSLELLRVRLADAHMEHLARGCKLTPKFCMESRFNLTALYIKCEACNTFEIVL